MAKDKSSKCISKWRYNMGSYKKQNIGARDTHLVVVEIQQSKGAVVAKALGEISRHFVVAQIQHVEIGERRPVRDGTRQVVLVQ